jgi:hypothetical protein
VPRPMIAELMNRWPSSLFTLECFSGFTSMIPYRLNMRLSPFVPETNPGAAVGKHVRVAGAGGVERGAHALADRLVPSTLDDSADFRGKTGVRLRGVGRDAALSVTGGTRRPLASGHFNLILLKALMLKRSKLMSLAAVAAVLVSGTATAMAATSDHPKKRTTQATHKQAPKSKATRTGSAPAQQPREHYGDDN